MPLSADFDIAIVGSGFAGSLLAMIARRLGKLQKMNLDQTVSARVECGGCR